MTSLRRRHALRPLVLALGLALSQTAWPGTVTHVLTGDAAPGVGSGVSFATLSNLQFNNAGQIAYLATLSGAGISSLNDQGIWRDSALIARTGSAAPGAGGANFGVFVGPQLNAAGQVAFTGFLVGAGVTSSNVSGIWRDSSLVVRQGDVAIPGAFFDARFTSVGVIPQLDAAGRVVYEGHFATNFSSGQGIWRDDTLVVRTGDAVPGQADGVTLSNIVRVGPANTAGQSLFYGNLAGPDVTTSNNRGLWRDNTLVMRNGDAVPGIVGGKRFLLGTGTTFDAAINEFGQVAYLAGLGGSGVTTDNNKSLWRDDTLIARTGHAAPGAGGDANFSTLFTPLINRAGQVAYGGTLTGGGVSTTNNAGIWRDDVLIARTGDAIPGSGGAVRLAGSATGLQFNAAGVVAYEHGLAGAGVTSGSGLFLSDGIDTLQVARTGDAVAGSRVTSFFNSSVLNDKTQLAYQATLADGRSGIFVYTPALRWRSNGGGSWEDAANWTLGVNPADVHDVSLDPSTSLTVTGPTGNVALKSLQLGTGAGQATLHLVGGRIDAGTQVQIGARGVLSGSGTVQALGGINNAGLLAPGGEGQIGSLQLAGALASSGIVQLDLARSSSDRLDISGDVQLGGTLKLALLDGQRLTRNSSFTVMSWGTRTDNSEFATLDFAQASGYRFATTYGATGLSVTVTAVPYTWTGAATGGSWDVVQNWNDGTDGRPQAGDTVLLGSADTVLRTTIAAATVTGTGRLTLEGGAHLTLSDSGNLGAASLLQGRLTNNGRLVVTGPSTWISTELRGAGVTRLEGATAISGTDFDGTSSVLGGHTLELAGTTTFTGRRGLSVGDGGTLVNQGSWVDQTTSDVTLGNFNGGTGRFINQGSFTKASNTRTLIGETSLEIENTGSINVNAGYLRLSGSRVNSTGALNIAVGAELSLVSNDATLGGSVLNEGTLSLDGGVLTMAGDLLVQGSGLTRVKSTINNSSALRITGTVDWVESTLRGSGSTRMDGPVMLTGDRSRGVLGGHTVELAGTTTQVGTGGFSIGQGARLRNLGTWLDAAPGNVGIGNFNGGATPQFENVGSFTKTSAFVTEIGNGLNFINTGTLDVQAGTLRISDNATLTAGQVKIASGATLDLARGSIALSGTVQNAGTLALTGATVLVTDSAAVQGGLTTFKGVMANTGQLRMSGNVDWFEGDLRGSGTTRMDGPVALRGTAGRQLRNGQTLELAGTTTQVDAGTLQTANGARLVNLGTWVDAANGNVHLGNFGGGAPSRFDNVGRFTKTSAFVTDIGNGLVLNNTGTIDIQAGTLRMSQAFNNQGLLNVAAGAELASTVVDLANAGTLAGDGTVRTVGSFFSLNNTGTLAAGGLNDAGTLSLVGGLTQEAGGIFLVDLGSTAAGGFDLLTVSGAASLGGTLAVNLLAGAHFNVGDSFTVMTWTQRLGDSQFASLDLTQAGGYGFAADYGANSLTLRVMTAPVPEPGSWALMAAGLLGVGLHSRRRRATTLR